MAAWLRKRLRQVLAGHGVDITGHAGSEELHVTGVTARGIGLKAAAHGIALFEPSARAVSLEAAFMGPDQGCRRISRLHRRRHRRHRDPREGGYDRIQAVIFAYDPGLARPNGTD